MHVLIRKNIKKDALNNEYVLNKNTYLQGGVLNYHGALSYVTLDALFVLGSRIRGGGTKQ